MKTNFNRRSNILFARQLFNINKLCCSCSSSEERLLAHLTYELKYVLNVEEDSSLYLHLKSLPDPKKIFLLSLRVHDKQLLLELYTLYFFQKDGGARDYWLSLARAILFVLEKKLRFSGCFSTEYLAGLFAALVLGSFTKKVKIQSFVWLASDITTPLRGPTIPKLASVFVAAYKQLLIFSPRRKHEILLSPNEGGTIIAYLIEVKLLKKLTVSRGKKKINILQPGC